MSTRHMSSRYSDRVFEFGAFRVEVGERRLFREGVVVPLAPKAFDTLVVLLESAGRLVSKEHLMSRVWAGRVVEEAAVAKTVFILRKALGDSREAPSLIGTVSKGGYRFIAPVRVMTQAASGVAVRAGPQRTAVVDRNTYEGYLRGRYMLARRTAASIERAIDLLTDVGTRAPAFAPALMALADGYIVHSIYNRVRDADTLERADEALARALELDCSPSQGYATRGYASFFRWDFQAAEADLLHSIEADPRNLSARQWYAEYLRLTGRQSEAMEQSRIALRIDPFSLIVNVEAALPYYYLGEYRRAEEQLLKTIELDPSFASAHGHLAIVYDAQGRYSEALVQIMHAQRLDGSPWIEAERGIICTHLGRTAEARSILADLVADPLSRSSVSASIAELKLALGDVDGALESLEDGVAMHSSQLVNIRVDPRLAPLRREPRFLEALRRIGLLDSVCNSELDDFRGPSDRHFRRRRRERSHDLT